MGGESPHPWQVIRAEAAAIQLRLGREQEALIHYEGVLRGYVAEAQILSAIALCQRIRADSSRFDDALLQPPAGIRRRQRDHRQNQAIAR